MTDAQTRVPYACKQRASVCWETAIFPPANQFDRTEINQTVRSLTRTDTAARRSYVRIRLATSALTRSSTTYTRQLLFCTFNTCTRVTIRQALLVLGKLVRKLPPTKVTLTYGQILFYTRHIFVNISCWF